jgi:hypothetical protein
VAAGVTTEFWWRDDDLIAPSDKFDKLGTLARAMGISPLVAVIPADAQTALAELPAKFPEITFCQHGYGHVNHEAADVPKSEFGESRHVDAIRADLISGRRKMEEIFGRHHAPIFVPPWNRFSERHLDILREEMFFGFSGYRAEAMNCNANLRCFHVDIDVLHWGDPCAALPVDVIVSRLVQILKSAALEPIEPIGILTHHRMMDVDFWKPIEDVFALILATNGAEWKTPQQLFVGSKSQ